MLFLMKQILIHSWFPPTVRGTHEASTSLDVWTFHSCFLILHCQVSIIDVACFQGYLSVCWGSCKLGYPTTGEQLIKSCHYLGWWKRWREWFGPPQPWHSVLLSLGQGEPSSWLQMRHLPDQILKILSMTKWCTWAWSYLLFRIALYALGALFSEIVLLYSK